MKKKMFALLLSAIIVFSMIACGETEKETEPKQKTESEKEPKTKEPQEEEKEEPINLTGFWKTPVESGVSQEAVITEDTIKVYWVFEEYDSKPIYWSGTYEAPTESTDEYTWTSIVNTVETESSYLGSTEDTKDFIYKDGKISYEASLENVTETLELTQISTEIPDAIY